MRQDVARRQNHHACKLHCFALTLHYDERTECSLLTSHIPNRSRSATTKVVVAKNYLAGSQNSFRHSIRCFTVSIMHYLVTRGTDGIGRALVLELLRKEPDIILTVVGRSPAKWEATQALLPEDDSSGGRATFQSYDLSLMHQVQELANYLGKERPPLQGIVHCAGVTKRRKTLTTEGLETVFAVQYLARYYLSTLLVQHLTSGSGTNYKKNDSTTTAAYVPAVVVVSAGGTIANPSQLDWNNLQGERHYHGVHALKHESIANDMQILEFGNRQQQIRWYNYGPGYVRTNLLQDMPALFQFMASRLAGPFIGISPEQAARDIMQLLFANNPDEPYYSSGLYQRGPTETYKCVETTTCVPSYLRFRIDPKNRAKLFDVSNDLLKRLEWSRYDLELQDICIPE